MFPEVTDPKLRKVFDLYTEADKIALDWIEEGARKVLKICPSLDEYIMGMGSAFFTLKNEDYHLTATGYDYGEAKVPKTAIDFLEWVEELNDMFNSKGAPMRFTAKGPKITDW